MLSQTLLSAFVLLAVSTTGGALPLRSSMKRVALRAYGSPVVNSDYADAQASATATAATTCTHAAPNATSTIASSISAQGVTGPSGITLPSSVIQDSSDGSSWSGDDDVIVEVGQINVINIDAADLNVSATSNSSAPLNYINYELLAKYFPNSTWAEAYIKRRDTNLVVDNSQGDDRTADFDTLTDTSDGGDDNSAVVDGRTGGDNVVTDTSAGGDDNSLNNTSEGDNPSEDDNSFGGDDTATGDGRTGNKSTINDNSGVSSRRHLVEFLASLKV